jgi:hypothetical protein
MIQLKVNGAEKSFDGESEMPPSGIPPNPQWLG